MGTNLNVVIFVFQILYGYSYDVTGKFIEGELKSCTPCLISSAFESLMLPSRGRSLFSGSLERRFFIWLKCCCTRLVSMSSSEPFLQHNCHHHCQVISSMLLRFV